LLDHYPSTGGGEARKFTGAGRPGSIRIGSPDPGIFSKQDIFRGAVTCCVFGRRNASGGGGAGGRAGWRSGRTNTLAEPDITFLYIPALHFLSVIASGDVADEV
jgi:hypothetical protein